MSSSVAKNTIGFPEITFYFSLENSHFYLFAPFAVKGLAYTNVVFFIKWDFPPDDRSNSETQINHLINLSLISSGKDTLFALFISIETLTEWEKVLIGGAGNFCLDLMFGGLGGRRSEKSIVHGFIRGSNTQLGRHFSLSYNLLVKLSS